MKKTYYSHGKLLITGEYVVLDGAMALALPTKFGQSLVVEKGENKIIQWKSYDNDNTIWFNEEISFKDIIGKDKKSESETIKNTLIDILHQAYLLNPNLLQNTSGFSIATALTFPRNWGLGTSSTLINNIAQWAEVNPFVLLKNSFGGSGYDIACARSREPLLYQLQNGNPIVEPALFKPGFRDQLFFVYLNKKQNSQSAIAAYYAKRQDITKSITSINAITQKIIHATDLESFSHEIKKHEMILSDILEMKTVQETYFNDFNGIVKSLGAWGGDFVLAASKENPTNYFAKKGFTTVIPYAEMIL